MYRFNYLRLLYPPLFSSRKSTIYARRPSRRLVSNTVIDASGFCVRVDHPDLAKPFFLIPTATPHIANLHGYWQR